MNLFIRLANRFRDTIFEFISSRLAIGVEKSAKEPTYTAFLLVKTYCTDNALCRVFKRVCGKLKLDISEISDVCFSDNSKTFSV